MKLAADRRGSVAMMTAILAPVLIMALAMGVEVTSWSVRSLELQRVADAAAWAGAAQYATTSNSQGATSAAAALADINGVSHTTTRTWNAATATTSDDMITAQMVSGVKSASDKAVKVTVKRSIAKSLTRIFPGTASAVTVSAVAVAEIGSLGPQPCITALGHGVDGITTGTDVSVTGNATLSAQGCSLRSDDGISEGSGTASISLDSIYAGGTISGSNICCDLHPNSGQISDPYASYAPVQDAIAALSPGSGSGLSVKSSATQSVSPGTYSSWNINGTVNLAPGTYYVNGDISVGAQAVINGTGVTIVTSGAIAVTGGAALALTAPLKNASVGVAGVLFAGKSSAAMSLLGNSSIVMGGLIYLPNATLKFGGTAGSSADACLEVIASAVTLVGTSDMAANCSAYGTVTWGSLAGPAKVSLVQ